MSNILEQLFFGEIRPEEVIVPKNPEYRSLSNEISNSKEQLKMKLSENDIELLEETFDLLDRSSSMYSTEVFIYGFKMGALMITEVFANRG
ncbi:hypothetical protein M3201_03560 [Paenibacillus motobuensis]|uniref:DUF6809 family protein n=1 Tax=Paenibacillus TaxID=44249 RepID=UPI00203CE618|nr:MULTISPECIES: DUF6809 family protein [Paenibacillus]MCM3038777.1 hypothetical protein [Paenibacillus lutimineralis]MCM3645881.1 hypothetical protein [Paenibacillus motobuensis]